MQQLLILSDMHGNSSALRSVLKEIDNTHNEQATDGKNFVTFIACIIRSYMSGRLCQYLQDNSTSMSKVYRQLSNIIMIESEGQQRFAKVLAKKQWEILQQLDAHAL